MWLLGDRGELVPGEPMAGSPTRVALRPAVADLCMVAVFALALAPLGLVAASVIIEVMIRESLHSLDLPFAFAIAVLGMWVATCALALFAQRLLRTLVPETIASVGELVRVRVDARWGLRTDVWFHRRALRGVRLAPWQLGTLEVWIATDRGAMFRVSAATSPLRARLLAARLEQLLRAPATEAYVPLPAARAISGRARAAVRPCWPAPPRRPCDPA